MSINKMLIDATHPEETRVVVLRAGRVEEFDYESAARKLLRGNIYLAKVTRVEPSLQAGFIDYGGNRHGFLAFNEIHPDYYQIPVADRQALLDEEAAAEAAEEAAADAHAEAVARRRRQRSPGPAAAGEDDAHEGNGHGGHDAGERDGGDHSAHVSTVHDLDGEPDEGTPEGAGAEAAAGADYADDLPEETGGHTGPAEIDPEPVPGHEPDVDRAALTTTPRQLSDATGLVGDRRHESPGRVVDRQNDPAAAAPREGESSRAGPVEYDHAAHDDHISDHAPDAQSHDLLEHETARRGDPEARDLAPADAAETAGQEDALEELPSRPRRRPRSYKIQEVIKRRQVILVQVVKEERGNKGAALTTYLSLAGRYTVLMPNTARGGGISRKITNPQDRKRLKAIAAELEVPDGMGLIIRTAGAARTKQEIKRDYEYLLRLWESVRDLTLQSVAPSLVYEEGNLIKRSIRDLYNKDVEEIVVAGAEAHRDARDFMRMLMPSHAKNVIDYREPEPLFTRYQIERQLNAMFSPYVTLRSGGYLVINQTEALVAIDVNSGKSTREYSIEETALGTNLEASDEIARQLKLRDLAGLIVIDFIDMEEKRNNRTVERRLKDALRFDRARIQLGHISHFGLMEMSRQRLRTGVLEGSTTQCPHCQGTGIIRSTESVALAVLRGLEDSLMAGARTSLIATTTPAVALYILNNKRPFIIDMEARHGMPILVQGSDKLQGANFTIEKGAAAALAPRRPERAAVNMNWGFGGEGDETVEADDPGAGEESRDEDEAEVVRQPRRGDGRRDEARMAEGRFNEDGQSAGEGSEDGEGGVRRRRRRRRGRRGGVEGARDEGPEGTGPGIEGAEGDEDGPETSGEANGTSASTSGGHQADGTHAREAVRHEEDEDADGGHSEESGERSASAEGSADGERVRRGRRRGRRGGRRGREGRDRPAGEGGGQLDAGHGDAIGIAGQIDDELRGPHDFATGGMREPRENAPAPEARERPAEGRLPRRGTAGTDDSGADFVPDFGRDAPDLAPVRAPRMEPTAPRVPQPVEPPTHMAKAVPEGRQPAPAAMPPVLPSFGGSAPPAGVEPRPRRVVSGLPSEPRLERVVVGPDQAPQTEPAGPQSDATKPARKGWWQRNFGGE